MHSGLASPAVYLHATGLMPGTILHAVCMFKGRLCSHERAHQQPRPPQLLAGPIFCHWALPLHSPAASPSSYAPACPWPPLASTVMNTWWDAAAIVGHIYSQGPHSCLPTVIPTTIYVLATTPATTQALAAGSCSCLYVHHEFQPLSLLALNPSCWTWRCYWGPQKPWKAAVDPP